jgi:osmotically-inducible protein OsmY
MKLTMNRPPAPLLAAAALAAGLSACAPLVVGGAVMGGMMATDRRTTGTQVEDEGIELRAVNRLSETLGDRATCQRDQLQPPGAADRRGAHGAGPPAASRSWRG